MLEVVIKNISCEAKWTSLLQNNVHKIKIPWSIFAVNFRPLTPSPFRANIWSDTVSRRGAHASGLRKRFGGDKSRQNCCQKYHGHLRTLSSLVLFCSASLMNKDELYEILCTHLPTYQCDQKKVAKCL